MIGRESLSGNSIADDFGQFSGHRVRDSCGAFGQSVSYRA